MTINEAFKASVRAQVAKTFHRSWGADESLETILACVKAAVMESGLDETEARAITSNLRESRMGKVINPSQWAQELEILPDGTGFDAEGKAETSTFSEESDSLVPKSDKNEFVAHPSWIRRAKRGTGNKAAKGSGC